MKKEEYKIVLSILNKWNLAIVENEYDFKKQLAEEIVNRLNNQ